MKGQPGHVPVLAEEVLRVLDPRPGETYVDCTAGLGGHAATIGARLGATGTVVLNDVDPGHLAVAQERLGAIKPAERPRVIALRGNFADLAIRLGAHQLPLHADLVLADLGFSSGQMDDAARGLSFMREGPLDMRLDPGLTTTAADLVRSLPEGELAGLIAELGEDRNARRIARKLVAAREQEPILTTSRLAEIVRGASGGRHTGIDAATRTFQALRIAVNDELGSLQALLDSVVRGASGEGWLRKGARVGVISFHSLEDRLVKNAFADLARRGQAELLSRKPIVAGEDELKHNARARSAKLRAVRLRT
jgi:16S rRNA (cytosine1402-N4)-methyltransferase